MARLPDEDIQQVVDRTENLWQEVRGRRIFFSGGTGFFGAWLLESFLAANQRFDLGAEAVVLSRNPARFLDKWPHMRKAASLQWLVGDVRNFTYPADEFDFVIHAANDWSARRAIEEPVDIYSTIADGARHMLDFAVHCRAKKFLYASSGAIYGTQPGTLSHMPEDYPGAPSCLDLSAAYSEAKRAAELLCFLYSKHFEVKIARCFSFVGPAMLLDAHLAMGNFIRDAMKGAPIKISGDGTPRRSYLYTSDLTVWLWTLLFRAPSCRPYNVGSDRSVSVAELAEIVRQALNPACEIQIAKKPVPGAPTSQYVPSIERAKQELGLDLRVSLEEGIRKTAVWARA